VAVTLIHTPGHTPGSQCLLVDGRLLSGDTLFLEGCGRTDLPGSDPMEMFTTLSQRLSAIADDTVLYPGHFYAAEPSAAMGEVRATNFVLAPSTSERWLAMFS
jgi:glyoxylase-like metal-dependent hydrolase (beta-lactamase superfamily II)